MTASNQTQQTPTPGPWRIENWNDGKKPGDFYIGNKDGYSTVYRGPCCFAPLDRRNAGLIVRAVNSHDALVEALTCAKNILYLLTPEVSALGMRAYLIHEKIDAALASIPKEPT